MFLKTFFLIYVFGTLLFIGADCVLDCVNGAVVCLNNTLETW